MAKRTKSPLTKAQKLMVEDGAPIEFMLTAKAREELRALAQPVVVQQTEETVLSDEDKEIAADIKLGVIAASVMHDPVARMIHLSIKHAATTRRLERLAALSEREPRAPRRPTRPDDMVTIATIAAELAIVPRVARAALRALKYTKPAFGWAFTTTEATKVKGDIQTWLTTSQSQSATKSPSTRTPKSSSKSSRAIVASQPKKRATASTIPATSPVASQHTTKSLSPSNRAKSARKR